MTKKAEPTPGVCRDCGCTEEKACLESYAGIPLPCCWTDDTRTLCSACHNETAALQRAAAGTMHIAQSMDANGSMPKTDLATRAKICGALVAAYIAGASEENDIWRAADRRPNSLDVQPRNMGEAIRQPGSTNPAMSPETAASLPILRRMARPKP